MRGTVDILRLALHRTHVAPAEVDERSDRETTAPSNLDLTDAVQSAVALGLSIAATALFGYLAWAISSVHSVVDESLPCDPSVILNVDPIDPLGYSEYSDAQVQASEAHWACMSESLALLPAAGVDGRAGAISWPGLALADFLALLLIGSSWLVVLIGRMRRSVVVGVAMLTFVSLVAASFQVRYSETINLVSWITN